MQLQDKFDLAIRKKIAEGKLKESTVTIAKGGAEVTYGVARGALAVAAILGHGLAGIALKRPISRGPGARMIRNGFEAAKTHIDKGVQVIEAGLRQRRHK